MESPVPAPGSNQPNPDLPLLDLDAALTRLGDDPDLLRDLIGFFFEDSPPLLEQLQQGISERNASLVERAAHSLKGLASNFNGQRAVQAALRLEKMGHSNDLAHSQEALVTLQNELAALREALALYLSTHHA
jgi:two-component system, sensor histidine kinase and response regulator